MGWWTLGGRPSFTTPRNPRRFGLPHRAERYGMALDIIAQELQR